MKRTKTSRFQRVGRAQVGSGFATGNGMPKAVKNVSRNRTGSSRAANTRRPTGARLR